MTVSPSQTAGGDIVAIEVGALCGGGVGVGGGLIVKVTTLFVVPSAFLALRVTPVAPAVVGVPEIDPVAVFTLKPAGNGLAP